MRGATVGGLRFVAVFRLSLWPFFCRGIDAEWSDEAKLKKVKEMTDENEKHLQSFFEKLDSLEFHGARLSCIRPVKEAGMSDAEFDKMCEHEFIGFKRRVTPGSVFVVRESTVATWLLCSTGAHSAH